MNEILFECTIVMDEKRLAELSRMLLGKRRIIPLTLFLILSILWLLMIPTALLVGTFESKDLLYAVFSFGCLGYYLFLPVINAKKSMRRARKYHDGEIPAESLFFTETEVIAKDNDGENRVPYSKFDKAKASKNLLIITARSFLRVAVFKDSFTKGTYAEFVQFLRAKCPNLKIPD